jgi:SAM-dependent methyltransferase
MLLTRRSCALPDPSRPKLRHFYPLIGFVVPTLVVGYGVVIPRNGVAGFNELTVGFASAVIGACLTYVLGLRSALRASVSAPACQRHHLGWRRPEFLARQAAHPTGLVGWIVGHIMAAETATANGTTIALADLTGGEHVLEVGCGHGRAIARIARALPTGRVVGLDPSSTMIRLATRHNRELIAQGQTRVDQGDAAALPYDDASFDRILATHTVYFWPDLAQIARELRRVLKPHGRLVLGFGDIDAMRRKFPESVYTLRSADQIREALRGAGFADVRLETRAGSGRTLHWAVAQ